MISPDKLAAAATLLEIAVPLLASGLRAVGCAIDPACSLLDDARPMQPPDSPDVWGEADAHQRDLARLSIGVTARPASAVAIHWLNRGGRRCGATVGLMTDDAAGITCVACRAAIHADAAEVYDG